MSFSSVRLPLLDYLRFIAALGVVCFHYFFNGIENGKLSSLDHVPAVIAWAKYGYLGVDLFFIISGYVIFMTAGRRTTGQFIVSRAVRLYPAYLVAMLITAIFSYYIGGAQTSVRLLQVLANIFMYQPLHRQDFVDGVYWTLIVEINFYVMIALFLALGFSSRLNTFAILWPAIMLFATILHKGNWPLLGGYYSLFAGGALLSILRLKFNWSALGALFLCYGLSIEYVLRDLTAHADSSVVITVTLITAFYLVFGLVHISARWKLKLPFSKKLGELTYPLYLLHAHLGYMLLSRYANAQNRWTAYAIVFMFVLLLASLINYLVERKMADYWYRFFGAVVSCVGAVLHRLSILASRAISMN